MMCRIHNKRGHRGRFPRPGPPVDVGRAQALGHARPRAAAASRVLLLAISFLELGGGRRPLLVAASGVAQGCPLSGIIWAL
eukprot:4401221-Pyramimonas_sp.AAC.1